MREQKKNRQDTKWLIDVESKSILFTSYVCHLLTTCTKTNEWMKWSASAKDSEKNKKITILICNEMWKNS